MAETSKAAAPEEEPGGAANTESALSRELSDVLDGERSLWRASERLLALARPHIDEISLGIPTAGEFNIDIVARVVVRRTYDALEAIAATVNSPVRGSARVYLRSMTEDLIFVAWLQKTDEIVAMKYVQQSARVEALRAVKAQASFLPQAYRMLDTDPPDLGFGDVTNALERAQSELAELCKAQGWGSRSPSVRRMAEVADLISVYEFFYLLSSKTVHANLHEIARMVWRTKQSMDISSKPFEGIHADLAVVYGVWLFSYLMAVVKGRFDPIKRLMDSQEYSVWLAIVLVGPARNGRLPLMIHPEEFM